LSWVLQSLLVCLGQDSEVPVHVGQHVGTGAVEAVQVCQVGPQSLGQLPIRDQAPGWGGCCCDIHCVEHARISAVSSAPSLDLPRLWPDMSMALVITAVTPADSPPRGR
jgi:hypothetical protein